jgi:shikimate dehydrogenase
MTHKDIFHMVSEAGIVPILMAGSSDAAEAVLQADALVEAGASMIEVLFRNPNAPAALAEIRRRHPKLLLAAGTILGAEGAARAVAFGLRQKGVEVTVASRTLDRAKKIATEVGCKAIDWDSRYRLPYDCVINATPVGMHPNVDETPFDKEHLRSYMVVFDTVYNPENTLLVKQAREIGCRIVTGVEMFVRQAAIQFRIWHGVDPRHDVMREALKRATASAKQPV